MKITIMSCFICLNIFAQNQKEFFDNGTLRVVYEETDGRLDGKYISMYRNGEVKASGNFKNNLRIGKWSVWDSTGNINVERKYFSPFIFKGTYPKKTDVNSVYETTYNEDGYIDYFNVKEKDVYWIKGVFRFVTPKDNPLLFEGDQLLNFFNDNIEKGNISGYNSNELIGDSLKINTPLKNIVGLKIKEYFFIDTTRFISETRITGICPVVYNPETKDTTSLYWVCFPHIRKHLAQQNIITKKVPKKIKTLDDLFFYRHFYGEITKTDYDFKRTKKELEYFSNTIQFEMIEQEHNMWIDLLR